MTIFLGQLSVMAICLVLIACHALLFKAESNSWVEASLAHQWLTVVYWFVALAMGERILRRLQSTRRP
jgi:hypothetical protein